MAAKKIETEIPSELQRMSLRELAMVVERYGLDLVRLELIRRREKWPNAIDDSDWTPPVV